jgi:hypothetical protein
VELHIHAAFGHLHAFGFEEFALQAGVGLADQKFSAKTNDAMPGNAFSGGACGHCTASTARSAAEPKSFCEPPVGDNPAARNLFHEPVNRSPGHSDRLWNALGRTHDAKDRPQDMQEWKWRHQGCIGISMGEGRGKCEKLMERNGKSDERFHRKIR